MIVILSVETWIEHDGHFLSWKIKQRKRTKCESVQKYLSKETKLLLFCFIHMRCLHSGVYRTDTSPLHITQILQGHSPPPLNTHIH